MNGDDLNNDPEQKPSRWVINFFDWSEEKARTYPDCFEILQKRVKPERQRWKIDKDGNEIIGTYALRKPLPTKWWIYAEKRPALYETISKLDQVMVINRYSKHLSFDFQVPQSIFSDSIYVFSLNTYVYFSILSSTIHEIWAWKNSSTMGISTLRYSGGNAFETFPFPDNKLIEEKLKETGMHLYKLRKEIMKEAQIGFTETYNLFHNSKIDNDNKLFNSIINLRNAHQYLDNLILQAYEWNDIELKHNFYELEHLPENDRVRFTIHSKAKQEILNRLIQLNHEYTNLI